MPVYIEKCGDLVGCFHSGTTNKRPNMLTRKDRATQPMDQGRLRWAIVLFKMIVISYFKIIDERQNYLYMIMNNKKKIIIHFNSLSSVEIIRISFFRIYKEAKRHRAAIRFSLNGFSSHSEILLPTLHRNTFPGWTEILFNNK